MSILTDIITRCPQCSTAFRATAQVLKIANGTVRCGSCLGVFNANDYDINKSSSDKTSENDESWALDLLAEEETPEDIDLDRDLDNDIGSHDLAPQTTKEPSAPYTASNTDENTENQSLFIDIINNDLQDSNHAPLYAQEDSTADEPDTLITPNNTSHSLDDITLQAYDMDDSGTPWPWAIGVIFMGLLLIMQTAWWRFDTLSAREPYRQYYSKACEVLNCSLPLLSNLGKIRTTHLVIRAHPDEKNALIADAIIINDAPFEQAFPALQLEFRSIDNTVIASRDFQPNEYLKGELMGTTIMPAKQAIQLSLSVIDPGKDAVNYRINTRVAKKTD
jgi:predicted Zn finger-like uncharacterized protein